MSLSLSKTLFSKQKTSQDLLLTFPVVQCVHPLLHLSYLATQHLRDSSRPSDEDTAISSSREEQWVLPVAQHLDGDILPVQFLELGSLMREGQLLQLVLETSACNMLHDLEWCSGPFVALSCELLWHLLADSVGWALGDVLCPCLC